MECFNCRTHLADNSAFLNLDEVEFEEVVSWFGLIHIDGPDEQFDEDGNVVMCPACISLAL